MNRFLASLSAVFVRIRIGLRRFPPVHVGLLLIGALTMVRVHNTETIQGVQVFDVIVGICLGSLSALCVRLGLERGALRGRAILPWMALLLFSILGWRLAGHFYTMPDCPPIHAMSYAALLCVFAPMSIFFLYREKNDRGLFPWLVCMLLVIGGCTAVTNGVLSVCLFAFQSLILDVEDKLFADLAVFLWMSIAPIILISLLPGVDGEDREREPLPGLDLLFRIIVPAGLLLLAILYLYIGKIAVRFAMPSGRMNWFASIALAGYLFCWLSLRASRRRFFDWVVRRLWVALLPVIAVQIVGLVIRFRAYGLTATRYAGYVTLAFGLFGLVLAARRRSPRALFPVFSVLAVLLLISPWNDIDVPFRFQETRLRAALERAGWLEDGTLRVPDDLSKTTVADARIITDAWNYLTEYRWIPDETNEVKSSSSKRSRLRQNQNGHWETFPTDHLYHDASFVRSAIEVLRAAREPTGNIHPRIDFDPWLDELLTKDDADDGYRCFKWTLSHEIPVGGYTKILPKKIDWMYIRRERTESSTRYLLDGKGLPEAKDAAKEIDITDWVETVLRKSGIDPDQPNTSKDYDGILDPEDAILALPDGTGLLVDTLNGYLYGDASNDHFSLEIYTILSK